MRKAPYLRKLYNIRHNLAELPVRFHQLTLNFKIISINLLLNLSLRSISIPIYCPPSSSHISTVDIVLIYGSYKLILQNISPPRRDEIFSPPINNPLKKSILPSFLKKFLKNFLFLCSSGSDSPEISVLTDKIIPPLEFILKN